MKKAKISFGIIIALVFIAIVTYYTYTHPLGLLFNSSLDEEYFGKSTYSEVKHLCGFKDKKVVQPILDQIENAFSYIDNNEKCDCKEKFGELSQYCFCNYNERYKIIRENHNVKFITANTEDDTGYIWIYYDQEALDENDQICEDSKGILSRIEIKKINREWTVININEHP